MSILKIKGKDGKWYGILTVKGDPGEPGPKGDTYEITEEDYNNIASIVEINIQPTLDDIEEVAETAESIARGKSQAIVFETFDEMEVWLKDVANKGIGLIGDNLYIKQMWIDEEETKRQPDYWIAEVLEEPNELGYYYEISDLGVEHPDLTNVVKNTDYANSQVGGVVKVSSIYGVSTSNNILRTILATNTEIDDKTNQYKPIVPSNLDYAVKSVVGGHITLTQAEYDALVEAGTIDENTYYYIKEE